MADVGSGTAGTCDRGQLLLVAALGLAILFVTLALILNTAIYTENLATRSSDIGGGTDAVRYHDAARDGVGRALDYINAHNNTSYTDLHANLTASIAAFRNHSARLFAASDRAVETNLDATVNGARIAQTTDTRDFTDKTGTTDWVVVEDVDNIRAFTINVSGGSLQSAGSGDEFQLILEGTGGNQWILNVTNGAPPVVGIAHDTTATFTCTGSSTPLIDVTAGEVDGASCDGLDLAEGLTPPYDIRIVNGDNVTGTFSMVVDNDTLAQSAEAGTATHLFADGGGQPFAAHAVYSANVTVVYQTPRLYYNATLRVAPEESDG